MACKKGEMLNQVKMYGYIGKSRTAGARDKKKRKKKEGSGESKESKLQEIGLRYALETDPKKEAELLEQYHKLEGS